MQVRSWFGRNWRKTGQETASRQAARLRARRGPPRVSVVVPVHNTESFLERCLRSVMAQTQDDIEILVVDDCSPDNSAAIVERLMREDPRMRLIRHEQNLGLGGARNTGVREARSEWIATVDSDDYIRPRMIEALFDGTLGGRFDVVCCGFDRIDEEGALLSYHHRRIETVDPILPATDIISLTNPAQWNKLIRRSLFLDHGIEFPRGTYFEDLAAMPKLLSKARSYRCVGGNHYQYVVRANSIMNRFSDKHHLDHMRVYAMLKEFLIREGTYEVQRPFLEEKWSGSLRYHARCITTFFSKKEPAVKRFLRELKLLRDAYSFDPAVTPSPETVLSEVKARADAIAAERAGRRRERA
jgi:glycosyltransferase involved in cell wall biosynthesis